MAAHLVMTAYGFWLPNDERGSWSDFVRRWELLRFGPATKTDTRRSIAGEPASAARTAAAKRGLMYTPVIFSGAQALAIANGFAACVRKTGCIVYACAVMPDHVHLVVARHDYPIQQLGNLLKGEATKRLRQEGLDPFGHVAGRSPSPWAQRFWKVWLDTPEDVRRSIEYTNDNPIRAGFKPQNWSFVTPYASF